MQCPSCSAKVSEGSNFCEQCGTARATRMPDVWALQLSKG